MLLLEEKGKKEFSEERKEKQCFPNVSKFGLRKCVTTETQIIVFLHHNFPGVGIYMGRGWYRSILYFFTNVVDSKILVILLNYYTHLRAIICIDALVNGTDFDLYYVGQELSRY